MFEMMVMAENIKKYRKQKGLKQNEFAELLGISPQSVSKWECAQACPSIENLCEMSAILDVSVDSLISREKNMERRMIGIDGGGSKTEFILFTESGKILKRVLLGGSNPNNVGMESTINTFTMGIDALVGTETEVCGIFVGASGLDTGENTKEVKNILKKKYPNAAIRCENDIFNVIACGTNPDRCIAAICGTGIAVYANENGELRRFGGRGYLLDEGGSGYHIGRDAICAALDVEDGLQEKGLLSECVRQKLGAGVWDSIRKIYGESQSYMASFATCVFEAYAGGDEQARQILEKNAAYLAKLINMAAESGGKKTHIVASGSIVARSEVFRGMLMDKLKEDLVLEVPDYPPVYGACIMACKLCGIKTDGVKEQFMHCYEAYNEK